MDAAGGCGGELRRGEDHAGARICDGIHSAVHDMIWERADTLVWLDLPRSVVTCQIVRRSVSRAVRRTELWNGNRENWRMLLSLHDPQKSVIAWSIAQHNVKRRRYRAVPADPRWAHLRLVRLRSRAAAREWLASVRR